MPAPKHSSLYRAIEPLHGDKPWGTFLDAGTGANSLRWVTSLAAERWVAVTGSSAEAEIARTAVAEKHRPQDQIIVGNWADPDFLKGQTFDTVLSDYLLGAIEGFAPYFQPYLFPRLRALTGQALYVTGLEPYVPTARPRDRAARLIWEIGRFRDACVLLKGGMPYREYPAQWVIDQLQASGFTVRSAKHFKIGYKDAFVNAQIKIALHGLDALEDKTLVTALQARGDSLRRQAVEIIKDKGALRGCQNYVIAAEPT